MRIARGQDKQDKGAITMAQGILSGIALGAVFSVGAAAVVSVMVPLEPQSSPQTGGAEQIAVAQPPQNDPVVTAEIQPVAPTEQPTVTLRAPLSEEAPTQVNSPAPAPQIAGQLDSPAAQDVTTPAPVNTPSSETAAVAADPTPLPQLEDADAPATGQAFVALPPPQTGAPADLTTPRPLPQALTARVAEDAPVLPNPQALAPMIPDDGQDAQIVVENPVAPEPPIAVTDAQNEGEETFIVVEPAPSANAGPQPDTEPAQSADAATVPPVAESQNEPASQATEQEPPTVIASVPKPRVRAVPGTPRATIGSDQRITVGRPANSLITADASIVVEADAEVVTQTSVSPQQTAPVRTFAQPFENPEGKPLMSIVLMDNGVDLEGGGVGLPALSSFPYPVSFAVDTSLPDAGERMARYRREGFDVLAIVDLPNGAQPSDAEVSLSVALNNLPEVVGVLEGTGAGLQGSREVADQVTNILKASGHGLVTQSRGLNSMPKLAVKEGVPAAAVFRDFDSADQTPRVIRRFLDQAAFKAGQEGGVIMLGRLRPETIEALLVWGLADRAGSVALAPVSAVLLSE
jgi:polysaccharide deacetylase 2 family uncharacterized protein YibQ